jgi:hypothetical protein
MDAYGTARLAAKDAESAIDQDVQPRQAGPGQP